MGTVNLLEAAHQAGVGRVIYTSCAVTTATPRRRRTAMCRSPNTAARARYYDVSKNASEGMGRNYARVYGIEFAALRFAGIYGPGKMARHSFTALRSQMVEEPFAGKPFHLPDGGDQLDDMIFVDDVAEAIVTALLAPKLGFDAYNIASGEGHTLREFAAAIRTEIPGADVEIGPGTRQYGPGHNYAILISAAKADLLGAALPDRRESEAYVDTLGAALRARKHPPETPCLCCRSRCCCFPRPGSAAARPIHPHRPGDSSATPSTRKTAVSSPSTTSMPKSTSWPTAA